MPTIDTHTCMNRFWRIETKGTKATQEGKEYKISGRECLSLHG